MGDEKLQGFQKGGMMIRVNLVTGLAGCVICDDLGVELRSWMHQLDDDVEFLDEGFNTAVENYPKKYNNPSTADESLKSANWNVVDFQTLLQQVQLLKQAYETELINLNPPIVSPAVMRRVKGSLRGMASEAKATFVTCSRRSE